MEQKRKALNRLCVFIVIELAIVALTVWVFDPFYQYHEPFWGMKAVLNDRDNQMAGSVRNFSYDSVLMGSSVAENFDSSFLDENYDCKTLKLIKSSGSVADLLYYLDMAQREHELKNVFWCLDIPSINSSPVPTLYNDDIPRYLHTKTVLDDAPYLFNKEILFIKIPYMLAAARQNINTDGNAYNWARDKEFSAVRAMQAYDRPAKRLPEQDFSGDKEDIEQSVALIEEQIEKHPEIQYRFMIPPFSMLWWDCAYTNGTLEKNFYILEQTIPRLLVYDNVEVYFFQNEENIICDLDNYMDMLHYSPEINQYMLEQLCEGNRRVTKENWSETVSDLRRLVQKITEVEIYDSYNTFHIGTNMVK